MLFYGKNSDMERMSPVRTKQMRLVVTFYTVAGAIVAEQRCRKAGLEGGLISVPRCLTSDCWIAWSAPPGTRAVMEQQFLEAGIETAGFHELLV